MSPLDSIGSALEHYNSGHFIYTKTFSSLRDPKILLAVISHLHDCNEIVMKLLMQKQKNDSIEMAHFQTIQEIQEITELHKTSPVEFKRKDNMILCSDSYNLKTINSELIERYLSDTKEFLDISILLLNRKE